MENPFEIINQRLEAIEILLQELISIPKSNKVKNEGEIEFLNVQQTADYVSLSKATVYGLIHKLEIPNYKRGKRVYFKKSEIDSWLMQNKRKSINEIEQEALNLMIHKKS